MKFVEFIKRGNLSSGLATLGNLAVALAKMIVAIISGNDTMFATAMQSFGDTTNQLFVFIGSILAKMSPSERFPQGFGRLINIFCMVAVIVVSFMAYKTIKSGWLLMIEPDDSTNFILNIIVLVFSFAIDGAILYKTMTIITEETNANQGGNLTLDAFKHVKDARPATKLVFYEDIVATIGAILAIIGIVLSQYFGLLKADGIVSIIIGLLMLVIVFRIGYDNMVGLIGVAAPAGVKREISGVILEEKHVVDINKLRVTQEGRTYHVDAEVELKKGLSLAEADDIAFSLKDELLKSENITDVDLGIIEDDGI